MKIARHTAMLAIPREDGAAIYPTLLWGEGALALVDAGFPGQLEDIRRAIAAEGFAAEELTHLIFTHGDGDHVGCARELLALAPGCRTLAHRAEASAIDGSGPPPKVAHRRLAAQGDAQRLAALDQVEANYRASYTVPVSQPLEDGEVLPLCGGIRVIHAPGHTDGHVFLFVEADGVLITGDGINAQEGRLAGPNPVHTIDMPGAMASIARLAAMGLPIGQVVSYHGGLVAGDIQRQLFALGEPSNS